MIPPPSPPWTQTAPPGTYGSSERRVRVGIGVRVRVGVTVRISVRAGLTIED